MGTEVESKGEEKITFKTEMKKRAYRKGSSEDTSPQAKKLKESIEREDYKSTSSTDKHLQSSRSSHNSDSGRSRSGKDTEVDNLVLTKHATRRREEEMESARQLERQRDGSRKEEQQRKEKRQKEKEK